MDIQDIMHKIDEKVQYYRKNLDLEDDFIMNSCKKLASDLCQIFETYHIKADYTNILENIVKPHLFYEHKASKNKYESDNELSIRSIKKIAQLSIEEKMPTDEVNYAINPYRDDIDRTNLTANSNIDGIYPNILNDLKRRINFENDDFWFDIRRRLESSKEMVSREVSSYRNQNSAILHSIEEVVTEIGLSNSKCQQILNQIDEISDIQENKNYQRNAKYIIEITNLLNYEFNELSKEVLSLVSSDDITSQNVAILQQQMLNSILPEFNKSYTNFFDTLTTRIVPELINVAKSLVQKGKEVDFENNKELQNKLDYSYYSNSISNIIGVYPIFSFEPFDTINFSKSGITDLIAQKYSIPIADPKYSQIESLVEKRLGSMYNYSSNLGNHIIKENAEEIQKRSKKVVDGAPTDSYKYEKLENMFK